MVLEGVAVGDTAALFNLEVGMKEKTKNDAVSKPKKQTVLKI